MTNRPRLVLLIALLVVCAGASSLVAQRLEPAPPIGRGPAPIGFDCTAEALNIGGFVGSDGSVAVFNVPTDQGRLRLRLTCEDALGSLFGESPLVGPIPGDTALVDEILFDGGTPIASGLRITPADARIEGIGQILQLQVTGDLVDGSAVDLAAASTGTTYVSSNPAIASVDADGRVELHDSGTVLITASNEGVLGFAWITGLAAPIASLDITPSPVELVANSLFPTPIEPLTLTATLSDGTQVDLSSAESGTQWASSAPTVAEVDADGRVFGLSSGIATITATHDGSSVEALVQVSEMAPTPVLAIDTPGYAYDIEFEGAMLFIADGPAGLQFYDTSGSAAIPDFDPGGPAYDVRVRDGLAAVAMGAGIALVDVVDVTAPTLLATIPTLSVARDVWLSGDRLVAALDRGGLGIWDVTDPVFPSLLGIRTMDDPDDLVIAVSTDSARGVTVALTLPQGGLGITVDWMSTALEGMAATPPTPSLIVFEEQGSVAAWPSTKMPLPGMNQARDVVLWGDTAWVANGLFGIHAIDVGNPSGPVRRDDTSLGFNARGVAARQTDDGVLVAGAAYPFVDTVPLFDGSLRNRGSVDFSEATGAVPRGAGTHGIALGDGVGAVALGTHGIRIFRWQREVDNGGIAPTVSIKTPVDGVLRFPGKPTLVDVTAVDDVAVERVEIRLDGELLAVDASSPYRATFVTGPEGTEHSVQARAVDRGGHWSLWTDPVTVVSSTDVPLSCVPVPTNFTAWYPFTSTGSTTFLDLAGGPAGYVVRAPDPGSVEGFVSHPELQGALSLTDFPNPSHAVVPDASGIDLGTGDFTIEMWVRTLDANSFILSKWRDSGYALAVEGGTLSMMMGTSGLPLWFRGGPVVNDGRWNHIAVVVDRDAPDGGQFFLNGQLSSVFDPTDRMGDLGNTSSMEIGRAGDSSVYGGLIDEMTFYSRALSEDEVFSIVVAGADGKCPP